MKILFIILSLFLLSCGSKSPSTSSSNGTPDTTLTGDISNGNTIYINGLAGQDACIKCHGTDGAGTGATSTAVTSVDLKSKSNAQIENAITNGRSSGGITMPDFSYSPQEITDIISYIRTL